MHDRVLLDSNFVLDYLLGRARKAGVCRLTSAVVEHR